MFAKARARTRSVRSCDKGMFIGWSLDLLACALLVGLTPLDEHPLGQPNLSTWMSTSRRRIS